MNWDLTKLCKDDNEFELKVSKLKEMIDKLGTYKGKLSEEKSFEEYYLLLKEFNIIAAPVYMYASMLSDLDRRNVVNAAKDSKVMNLFNQLSINTSFEEPELLSIGYDKVMSFINNNKELFEFKFAMENMFRKAKHILSAEEEQLLSTVRPAATKGGDLYSALSVADEEAAHIKFNGKDVAVTQGNWRSLIVDAKDAKERKKVFEAIYNYYEKHKNTYATIYEGILQANKANARVRGFDHILDSYLYSNNIPTTVFTNLVDVASKKNAGLHKYYKLRKKYLGLKNHYSYDRFLELAESNKKYTYDEAKAIYFDAIKDCPADFQKKAHMTLEEGYVDVYEKEGKRSGAYSSGSTNVHPFILLNFDGRLDDVFTLAHESGHSIHTLYSEESQPVMLQDYSIFVAEIASTFNEHLLLDYLMKSEDLTDDDKISLLQKAIDEIVGTFYRQTLFAHYEMKANELIEKDEAINHEVLSNIMIDLYKQYYGIDIKKEKLKQYVWCYIPHLFYTPFYVYQYATSFAASFKLYKNVKEDKENGFENYLNLLKSGGSDYPVEQARKAGVDFIKKDAFMAVVERMDDLVNKLEELLEKRK